MIWNFVIQILISVALSIIAYLITPKPKGPQPDSVKSQDNPTASANKSIAKIWGTIIIKDANCLWYGEKNARTYTGKKQGGGK